MTPNNDEHTRQVSGLLPIALAQAKAAYDRTVTELLTISRIESGAPENAMLDLDGRVWRWFEAPATHATSGE